MNSASWLSTNKSDVSSCEFTATSAQDPAYVDSPYWFVYKNDFGGLNGISRGLTGYGSVGLMARRTFRTTMRILLNASFCIAFWLGSAMAQETAAKQGGESAWSVASAGGVMSSELGLAALYYKQGNYVQAELTYRKIQASMEKTLRPNHPSMTGVL